MDSEAVLSVLFDFVGKGHFLYVAGVSRSWRWHYTPKAADETGNLSTTRRDAVATVATLQYAFPDGLEHSDEFHPTKDEFRPGVYEWAREHGLPLFVWVAFRTFNQHFDCVFGVFCTASEAKTSARKNLEGTGNWEFLNNGFRWRSETQCHSRWDSETYSHYRVFVVAFALSGLSYADENDDGKFSFPVYVISKYHGAECIIKSLCTTYELAVKSLQEIADQYKGTFSEISHRVSCNVGHVEYAIRWEGRFWRSSSS